MTLRERIKELCKQEKISLNKLEQDLGFSKGYISKLDKSKPNAENLNKIATALGVSLDYLYGNEATSQNPWVSNSSLPQSTGGKWIPVLGRVAAGIPIEAVEDIVDYEEITMDMATAGDHFALVIEGDSMEPKFSKGDVVIVRKQSDVESNDIAVVLVNGDAATIKRIKKRPEGIMLIPSNQTYEPMFYSNEDIKALPITILGKVVELRAKF